MTLEELTSKIDKKEQQVLKLTAKLNRLLSKDNLEHHRLLIKKVS